MSETEIFPKENEERWLPDLVTLTDDQLLLEDDDLLRIITALQTKKLEVEKHLSVTARRRFDVSMEVNRRGLFARSK